MQIIRYRDAAGAIHHAVRQPDGSARRIEGDLYGEFHITEEVAAVRQLLAPVQPLAIIGIGLNYRRHAEETGAPLPEQPVVFLKLPGAVQHPQAPIRLPRHLRSDQVDFEGELAVVIGRPARNVRRQDALRHVLGYTCANDVSARDWQKLGGGGQWCRGKTFDTFCPLGPVLVTADELADPNRLSIRTTVNGCEMQASNTADMIFEVARLIEFLSGSTTLMPGTVILTGTPAGVGMARQPPVWLCPGDTVSVGIEGIGVLTNPVEAEPQPSAGGSGA